MRRYDDAPQKSSGLFHGFNRSDERPDGRLACPRCDRPASHTTVREPGSERYQPCGHRVAADGARGRPAASDRPADAPHLAATPVLDMAPSASAVCLALYAWGPLRRPTIAAISGLPDSTVKTALGTLIDAGCVERVPLTHDARQCEYRLTLDTGDPDLATDGGTATDPGGPAADVGEWAGHRYVANDAQTVVAVEGAGLHAVVAVDHDVSDRSIDQDLDSLTAAIAAVQTGRADPPRVDSGEGGDGR